MHRPGVALLLFVISLACRSFWLTAPWVATPFQGDEPEYFRLAEQLAVGAGFVDETGRPTAFRLPGLPWFASLLTGWAADPLPVVRRTMTLVSCLVAPALFLFTLLLWGDEWRARIGGTFWALSPLSVSHAGELMGEELGALLVTVGFALSVSGGRRRATLTLIVAGLVLGAADLVRGYLILATLVPVAWLWFSKKPRAAVILLGATLVLPGGWIVRNATQLGAWTLSTEGSLQLWLGNNEFARGGWPGAQYMDAQSQMWRSMRARHPGFDDLADVARSKIYLSEVAVIAHETPGRVAWLMPRKLAIYASPVSYAGVNWAYIVALPLMALGVVALWRQRRFHDGLLLLMPAALVALVCVLTFGDPRFRQQVDPLLFAVAAHGVAWMWGRGLDSPTNAASR